mgnify:CR=1 FL=1
MKKFSVAAVALLALSILVMGGCEKKAEKAAAPAQKTKIVIASDCTWPPMEFINEAKEIVGFDVDFIRAVAEAEGFEVEIRNTAWDGIFAGLENNQYDAIISSVTITDERKKTMDFSDPYFQVNQAVVVAMTDQATARLADLKGKAVGAQIGTTGAMEVEKDASLKLKNYDEVGLAFEDLINGRIAAVVCDTPTAAQYALQNEGYKNKLRVAQEIVTDEFYGIPVKKNRTEVLDLINRGIKKVKDSPKYGELMKKWIP